MNLGIIIIVISTFVAAVAVILVKKGIDKIDFKNINFIEDSKKILPGASLFVINVFIYYTALKYGDVSSLFPITSLSYVWTAILAKKYLNERITLRKILGTTLIIGGVVLIGVTL